MHDVIVQALNHMGSNLKNDLLSTLDIQNMSPIPWGTQMVVLIRI